MISVTILTKNAARTLKKVLESLTYFDEVLVGDTGSTDETLKIAASFSNVKIKNIPFEGFGKAKNALARMAKHDTILSLDADEELSRELCKEIFALSLDPSTVYCLPFDNYFNNKKIKWCGWYPETHPRLYNRKKTAFSQAFVHEKVITKKLNTITLKNPVRHTPYETLTDFLQKMERYSTLFAKQYQGKRRSSIFTALVHAVGAFFKSYVLKKGFLGGYEGIVISTYNGHTAWYKYLKLREANKKC